MFGFFSPKPRVSHLADYALRPYVDSDHAALLEVIGSRFADIGNQFDFEGSDRNLTDIQHYWRDCGGEFMVLTHKGVLVGSLCVKPLTDRHFAAECDWFFLRREYEGKGLGLMLLKWCSGWCQQHGIQTVELWCSEKRLRTHRFYRKLGFVSNGVRKLFRATPPQYVLFFELDASNPATLEKLEKLFAHL